ncbi:MAG: formate dehydrogenase accessory sulfurtransferase FdhD [Caulobacterales bacterium]
MSELLEPHALKSPVERRAGRQWRVGEAADRPVARDLADEAAVGVAYDGRPHAVLMATPEDLEDLAVGFTLTERIAAPDQIEAVSVTDRPEGFLVDVRLGAEGRKTRAKARARTLEGRTSCGLCGVKRLGSAVRPLEAVAEGFTVRRTAIQRALAELEEAQTLGVVTRATHAAAWARPDGALALVREDVGRHNALDKLIGAGVRAGLNAGGAFAVITSRCSYEMVEKAAIAGFSVLVAISAPTALAIRKAEEAGLTLVALARADGHTVFARPDRIVG